MHLILKKIQSSQGNGALVFLKTSLELSYIMPASIWAIQTICNFLFRYRNQLPHSVLGVKFLFFRRRFQIQKKQLKVTEISSWTVELLDLDVSMFYQNQKSSPTNEELNNRSIQITCLICEQPMFLFKILEISIGIYF